MLAHLRLSKPTLFPPLSYVSKETLGFLAGTTRTSKAKQRGLRVRILVLKHLPPGRKPDR